MSSFLFDTNALIWWTHAPEMLSHLAFEAIGDGHNSIFVSAVSAMEISTKSRKGFATALARNFTVELTARGLSELPISADHAQLAGSFASAHADPWDRLLAAQATIERLALITNDQQMATFGIKPYW